MTRDAPMLILVLVLVAFVGTNIGNRQNNNVNQPYQYVVSYLKLHARFL